MDWKIYYGDGSAFSSDDGDPDDIPQDKRHNVMVCAVANKEQTGRDCWNQSDFYIYHIDEGWLAGDWTGYLDQTLHNTHKITAALQGRVVSDKLFKEIMHRAKTEPGLPAKSANRPKERAGQAYGPPVKDET